MGLEGGALDGVTAILDSPDNEAMRLPMEGSGVRKRREILANLLGVGIVGLELDPFGIIGQSQQFGQFRFKLCGGLSSSSDSFFFRGVRVFGAFVGGCQVRMSSSVSPSSWAACSSMVWNDWPAVSPNSLSISGCHW